MTPEALEMLERKRALDEAQAAFMAAIDQDVDGAYRMLPKLSALGRELSRAVGVYWMADGSKRVAA